MMNLAGRLRLRLDLWQGSYLLHDRNDQAIWLGANLRYRIRQERDKTHGLASFIKQINWSRCRRGRCSCKLKVYIWRTVSKTVFNKSKSNYRCKIAGSNYYMFLRVYIDVFNRYIHSMYTHARTNTWYTRIAKWEVTFLQSFATRIYEMREKEFYLICANVFISIKLAVTALWKSRSRRLVAINFLTIFLIFLIFSTTYNFLVQVIPTFCYITHIYIYI